MSRLLNIIRAHSGLRAFQEFIDSLHDAFCWLTINTDSQEEQTSWSDLVLINILGTEQSRQIVTLELIASPLPKLPRQWCGAGGSHQGPRLAVPSPPSSRVLSHGRREKQPQPVLADRVLTTIKVDDGWGRVKKHCPQRSDVFTEQACVGACDRACTMRNARQVK